MNFEGLEDDLDIGYMPTIGTGSRAAGMKKITRKSQIKPTPINTKKNDQMDLLDELLSPPKPSTKRLPNQSSKPANISIAKNIHDTDSFFDQPPAPNVGKNSKKDNPPLQRPSTAVTSTFTSNTVQQVIVEEPSAKQSSFKFKRPQTAVPTTKLTIQEQPEIAYTPSTRMMKPPLKRRQSGEKSKDEIQSKTNTGGLQLKLPQQPPKSGLVIPEDDKKLKPPSFDLNKKRSSIDMDGLSLNLNDDNTNKRNNEQNRQNNAQVKNNSNNNSHSNLFTGFGNNSEENRTNKRLQLIPQTKKQEQPKKSVWENQKNTSSINSHQNNEQTYISSYNKQASATKSEIKHEQLQKQIEFVKRNYQRHIDSLQENLQQQIKINKESRDRLMKEANTMIENQRVRMKKIHEEELERVKQMNDWEKKKIEENYKGQIQSLKTQIDRLNKTVQAPNTKSYESLHNEKKQIEYLEERLRAERKLLEEKTKLLDRREVDLEERQRQFNKRKRLEEERLRNEEKRIFQAEMDAKKMILHEKRLLEDQKQSIATELATLEMGNYKKVQSIQHMKSQIEVQKKEIQKQRAEMRNLNNTALLEFHKKNEELKQQKNRITKLQSELVNKLKIVETQAIKLKANATISYPQKPTKQNDRSFNTNLTYNSKTNEAIRRPMSVQRAAQQKKLENTQNRFTQLSGNVKQSLRINKKGQGFDLDNYLMSMAHYTRTREMN